MPTEMWAYVFEYCPDSASRVCSKWLSIVNEHRGCWTTVWIATPKQHSPDELTRENALLAAWRDRLDGWLPRWAYHDVGGIAEVAKRSGKKNVSLFVSLVGPGTDAWACALNTVLKLYAPRLLTLRVLYESLDGLMALPLCSLCESPTTFPQVRELALDHACDALFDGAQIPGHRYEGDRISAHVLLADDSGVARFPRLASLKTSQEVRWTYVLPDVCPMLKALDICVYKTADVFAAVQACPLLEALHIRVEGYMGPAPGVDDADADALGKRMDAIADLRVSGSCVDERCRPALDALDCGADRRSVVIECQKLWPETAALFDWLEDIELFAHAVHDGGHVLCAINNSGERRALTAPVLANYQDDDAWRQFYELLRPALTSLPRAAVIVSEHYQDMIFT